MLVINKITVPKGMVGHGVKGIHVALIDLAKQCEAMKLAKIAPIAKVAGEWQINEGVTRKVAHHKAVSVDGADRWVPTRRPVAVDVPSLLAAFSEGGQGVKRS